MADRMAVCPRDGAPLISTILFPKAEFYCLECGARLGWLDPAAAKPTSELDARYEALKAEWDEHAAPRLRVLRVWFRDCEECMKHGPYHEAHATEAEREAHDAAMAWLRERAAA